MHVCNLGPDISWASGMSHAELARWLAHTTETLRRVQRAASCGVRTGDPPPVDVTLTIPLGLRDRMDTLLHHLSEIVG
jgi:hypothetical protein